MSVWLLERKRVDGSSSWMVRYRTPDGSQRAESWPSRKDAKRRQRELEAAFTRRDWVDPRGSSMTVAEWCDMWLSSATGLRPRTREVYRGCVDRHIVPHIGNIPMGRLRPVDIQGWLADLEESDLAAASVHQVWRTLRRAMNVAVRLEVLQRDPTRSVDAPPAGDSEMRALSADELATLADAIDPRSRGLVLVGGWCGLRLGELAGLRWRHVDLLRRTITVEVQVQAATGGGWAESSPKTKKGRRSVQLPRVVVEALEQHLEAGFGEQGPDGYVFPSPQGGPLRASNWRRRTWAPATTAAGLEGLRPHDLRHTAATLALLAAKGNVKVVQERLGWSSIRLFENYTHALRGAHEDLADELDAMAAKAKPAKTAGVRQLGR